MIRYLETRMREATPRERWAIACEGEASDHINEVRHALEWAKSQGLKIERPIYPKDCTDHIMAGRCSLDDDGMPLCDDCERVIWQEY